jgi:nitrous oxidase accessory protein NosD
LEDAVIYVVNPNVQDIAANMYTCISHALQNIEKIETDTTRVVIVKIFNYHQVDNIEFSRPNTIITGDIPTINYEKIKISCENGFILLHNLKFTNPIDSMHFISISGNVTVAHCNIFGIIQVRSGSPFIIYSEINNRNIVDQADFDPVPNTDKKRRLAGVFVFADASPTISYNYFTQNFRGVRGDAQSNPEISYNTFDDNTKAVVMFATSSGTIHHNKITNGTEFGIALFHKTTTKVHDNYIENCQTNGIQCTENTTAVITRNIVKKCGKSGCLITKGDSSPFIHENVFSENKAYGIACSSPGKLEISHNIVSHNKEGGIAVFVGSPHIFKNNVTYSGRFGGILCLNDTTPLIEDNIVQFGETHGITLWGACKPHIKRNVICDNHCYGVHSTENQVHAVIEHNLIGRKDGTGQDLANGTGNISFAGVEQNQLQAVMQANTCTLGVKLRDAIYASRYYLDVQFIAFDKE